MAHRKKTSIDGISIEYSEGKSPAKVIQENSPGATQVLVPTPKGYELKNIADLRELPEGDEGTILTNMTPIKQGRIHERS
jgi:hypothetical protein